MDKTNLKKLIGRLLVLSSLSLGVSSVSHAYPTMTRKGYTSCSTCHYNPSGGGVLTSYGKYIAQEVYGTFNDSETALPYLVNPKYEVGTFEEPWVVAQVMARSVQTYLDTPQVTRRLFRSMQVDFEGGISHNGWQALGTVGPRLDSAIRGENTKKTIDVRRFWVGRVTQEYALRVGRFMPEYGIYHPHHNIPTRKGLFFNHNEEPNIIQGTHFSNTFDFTGAYISGRDQTQLKGKKGYSATIAYKTGMSRYGVSRLDTHNGDLAAGSNGIFAQVGHNDHLYVLAELDRKKVVMEKASVRTEDVAYLETGYEVYKAVNPYFALEYKHNLTANMLTRIPSIGLQWHPITHTEIVMQTGRAFVNIGSESQQALQAFIMANIYF